MSQNYFGISMAEKTPPWAAYSSGNIERSGCVMGSSVRKNRSEASRKFFCVMTGGTSGIGRGVVERLLGDWPDRRIVLIARSSPRIDQLYALPGARQRLSVINGDLASLKSVAQACDQITSLLGADPIDALALNAGIQVVHGNVSSTDGLELSFAVNYLAHFLVVERLKGLLHPGGRIVFTSREVADPAPSSRIGIGH